jgi:hypothetical protein
VTCWDCLVESEGRASSRKLMQRVARLRTAEWPRDCPGGFGGSFYLEMRSCTGLHMPLLKIALCCGVIRDVHL